MSKISDKDLNNIIRHGGRFNDGHYLLTLENVQILRLAEDLKETREKLEEARKLRVGDEVKYDNGGKIFDVSSNTYVVLSIEPDGYSNDFGACGTSDIYGSSSCRTSNSFRNNTGRHNAGASTHPCTSYRSQQTTTCTCDPQPIIFRTE